MLEIQGERWNLPYVSDTRNTIQINFDRLRVHGLPMEAPLDLIQNRQQDLKWKLNSNGLYSEAANLQILAQKGYIYCFEILLPGDLDISLSFLKKEISLSNSTTESIIELFNLEEKETGRFHGKKDEDHEIVLHLSDHKIERIQLLWSKRIENQMLSGDRKRQTRFLAVRNSWILLSGFALVFSLYLLNDSRVNAQNFPFDPASIQAVALLSSMLSCAIYIRVLPVIFRTVCCLTLILPTWLAGSSYTKGITFHSQTIKILLICHLLFLAITAWFRYQNKKSSKA